MALSPALPASAEQQRFIEETGLICEEVGLPRMAGRVLGFLLLCDPPHQSAAQIAAALRASAGSISGMTNLLIKARVIERVTFPGDRRCYYRMRPHGWLAIARERLLLVQRFRDLMNHGLALLPEGADRSRLAEVSEFYGLLGELFEQVLERWTPERSAPER
jgi:DNA-binding MarR family transcriptional regulator